MKKLAAIAMLAILFALNSASATPWAETGDRLLRQDIELLSAFGIIDGPATTWPIPWSQISRGIGKARMELLPAHVQRALIRVKSRLPKTRDYRRILYQVDLAGTTKARTFRGFDDSARQDIDVRASAERRFSSSYIRLTVNFRGDASDGKIQFDGSYLAQAIGNWVFYAGFVDQWWGPGNESALLLSTNARPLPKVGFMRLNPKPFGTKWLSWLGPWQFNVFVGRLETDRFVPHPLLAGIRLSINPTKRWEIGFSRTLQLCGAGRPCDPVIWAKALIGFGNLDNPDASGRSREPGNQLAGVDVRYTRRWGSSVLSLYSEIMGEDEIGISFSGDAAGGKGFILGAVSLTLGGSLSWGLENGGQMRLNVEATDTQANHLFGQGELDRSGVTYAHGIYRSGYTFQGRVIGHTFDGDSNGVTARFDWTTARDQVFSVAYRYIVLNNTSSRNNRISAARETMNMVEANVRWPTRIGDLFVEVRAADDEPNTPLSSGFNADLEVGIRLRF